MNEQKIRELAKELIEAGPEGDWYLLPTGAHNVVGYLSDSTIGEIAYKGKIMNISAVIEEIVMQVFKKLESNFNQEEITADNWEAHYPIPEESVSKADLLEWIGQNKKENPDEWNITRTGYNQALQDLKKFISGE